MVLTGIVHSLPLGSEEERSGKGGLNS